MPTQAQPQAPLGPPNRRWPAAGAAGAGVGVLGGMIGLGGAEFRLPLLIGMFGFLALQAVIVNKVLSLIVVAIALPARLVSVPLAEQAPHWPIVVNLLVGSPVGAYLGATSATRTASRTPYRVLAVLLVLIAGTLLTTHLGHVQPADLSGPAQAISGVIAGAATGVVAALMGVAGGALLGVVPATVLVPLLALLLLISARKVWKHR